MFNAKSHEYKAYLDERTVFLARNALATSEVLIREASISIILM